MGEGDSSASDWEIPSAPDDSADEDWEEDEEVAQVSDDEDEEETQYESVEASDVAPDFRDQIRALVNDDPCGGCLKGRMHELESFLRSLAQLSKSEKMTSIMTALAVLKEADTAVRRRGHGLRDKFAYHLPLVGRVCRESFCSCYRISTSTVARLRERIKGGEISPKPHGGRGNHNATAIDDTWLVEWFKGLAKEIGDDVPIKVRQQRIQDGRVVRYYSPVDYTLLPAYLTWDRLYDEMLRYIDEKNLQVRAPARSTLRQLMSAKCPTIRIRSVRSNVCDECTIYQSRMKHSPTTDETEAFGKHTAAARRMRMEYLADLENLSDDHAVIIMDFSQNLTLPSLTSTPSQWYFMSLWAVNLFGIYYANEKLQYNYIYGEDIAGKGSEEVISMVRHFLQHVAARHGPKRLTVYADNCGGQNKNNYVVKFLLACVHTAAYERVDLKFFVKGHTKNAVDRGFGHVRKKFERVDVWTMEQLLEVADSAASSVRTTHIDESCRIMKSFKPIVSEVYRDIPAIRKFQIFTMMKEKPGVVECRVGPDDEPVVVDLRKKFDGAMVDAEQVEALFMEHLDPLPQPKPNTEKILQMHSKIRSYVPDEYKDNRLYAAPTLEQAEEAQQTKRARAESRKKKRDSRQESEAVLTADEVMAVQVSKELQPQPKAKTTTKKKARKAL